MINSNLINTQAINSWLEPTEALIQDIQIWSIGLINDPYSASYVNDNLDTELNDFLIPQNNWKGFLSYFKRSRQLSIDVNIKWTTREEFIENMDRLREECYKAENTLYYKRWNLPRRQIKVNCVSFPENYEHYNLTFLKTTIGFTALEPFWYEDTRQSTTIPTRTASFVEEITNQWTDVSQPIIYMIIESWSITATELVVWDNTLTISNTLNNWDVLIINSEDLTITLNGSQIDYDWTFPEMKKWANFFYFNLTWTFELKTLLLNRINYV